MLEVAGRVFDAHIVEQNQLQAIPGTTVLEPVLDAARKLPAFVLDCSGENLRHHLFFEGTFQKGGIFKSHWRDAAYFGWMPLQAFLSSDGAFTCQDIANTGPRVDLYHLQHPVIPGAMPALARDGNKISVDFRNMRGGPTEIVDGPVHIATPTEPLNWGMWLLQCVPAAIDYVSSGTVGKFGCWAKLPWQIALLGSLGLDATAILQVEDWQTYTFNEMIFRSYPKIDFHVGERDRLSFLTLAMGMRSNSTIPLPERIFISRRTLSPPGTPRRLRNEQSLIDALSALGFVVVEPQSLPFPDQVALFFMAKVVVGLGGAGMFNTVFCRPGTKVVSIESSASFVANHCNLFSSLDMDYGVIFGERDKEDQRSPHHEWSIDVEQAVNQISAFL